MTHINPMSDSWSARTHGMPGVLHKFVYPFGNGQEWHFDFLHRNIKFDNLTINGNSNTSVNNPVPTTPYVSGLLADVVAGTYTLNANDPEALGMAAWGTTYHYTVKINNADRYNRTVAFRINNSDNVIFGIKEEGWSDYYTILCSMGGGANDWVEHSVTVNGDSSKTFEIITLPCGGNAGLNNQLMVY